MNNKIETLHSDMFPECFADVDHLEDFMSTPTQEVVDDLAKLDGDIMILGVGGKIGITMARMAKKACPDKRVIGVSRFSEDGVQKRLNAWGIETIVCDLLDRDSVNALPKVKNVIYMAGLKFDFRGREDFLWAMNTIAPQIAAEAFRESRLVTFSTIHVYPWSNPVHGGVTENDLPMARPGEYANSVVGRERTFEYYSKKYETPGRAMRFVYAIDPRYGVLQEIASWVLEGKEIPLETGAVNVMWQGDANCHFLRMLGQTTIPTSPINVGGPETVSVRYIAERFGQLLGLTPKFTGVEQDNCLFVNCDKALGLLGNPHVSIDVMLHWVAEWVKSAKPIHGKPSKFQVRSGEF